jgi:hypothetical protein
MEGPVLIAATVNQLLFFTTTAAAAAASASRTHVDPMAEVPPPFPSVTDGESRSNSSFQQLGQLAVFGTVVLMEAVPIVSPATGKAERHLLLVLNAKHQLGLFAFTMTKSSDVAAPPVIQCIKLFEQILDVSFYEQNYNGAMLSCTTTVENLTTGAGGKSYVAPPMVALAAYHKTIMLVDIACCIADCLTNLARKSSAPSIQKLFSDEFWKQVVVPRKEFAAVTPQFLDEANIHSIVFGFVHASTKVPLFVLHSDSRGRSHVAEYMLDVSGGMDAHVASGSATCSVPLNTTLAGLLQPSTKFPLQWSREGILQSDVEADARLLIAHRNGLLIVGPQLVTCLALRQGKRYVVTEPLTLVQSRGQVSEPRCSLAVDGTRFIIAFTNGALVHLHVRTGSHLVEDAEMTAQMTTVNSSSDFELHLDLQTAAWVLETVPESLSALPSRNGAAGSSPSSSLLLFVGSTMGNSLSVALDHIWSASSSSSAMNCELTNTGPILDLAVVREDAHRLNIVASTGMDHSGGLNLLRTAVNYSEFVALDAMAGLLGVSAVAGWVALSFANATRILRFHAAGRASEDSAVGTALEEVDQLVQNEETLLLHQFRQQAIRGDVGCLVQVLRSGRCVLFENEQETFQLPPVPFAVSHVAASGSAIVLAGGCTIAVVTMGARGGSSSSSSAAPLSCRSLTVQHEMSCVAVSDDGQMVAVGEWLTSRITVCPTQQQRSDAALHSFDFPSVPRSVLFSTMPMRVEVETTTKEGRSSSPVPVSSLLVALSNGQIALCSIVPAEGGNWTIVWERSIQLSDRAVRFTALPGTIRGGGHTPILCRSDVPAVLYFDHGRLRVVGLALPNVEHAAVVGRPDVPLLLVQDDNVARFGSIADFAQVTRTALPRFQGTTATKLSYLSHFRRLAVAIRRRDYDDIVLSGVNFTTSGSSSTTLDSASTPLPAFHLLESERCNFIESLLIGGPNDANSMLEDYRAKCWTPTVESYHASEASEPFNAVLIGTSFIFADEVVARSSRLLWGTIEDAESLADNNNNNNNNNSNSTNKRVLGSGPVFRQLGEKEISGSIQCACMVPNAPGRVAVGVNGTVVLIRWHPTERNFVLESAIPVGAYLVGLTPHFPLDDATHGLLVAGDWRHSLTVIKVNPLDGSMELKAWDGSLRGVMDYSLVQSAASNGIGPHDKVMNPPTLQGSQILMADELMNVFLVEQEFVPSVVPNTPVVPINFDREEGEETDLGGRPSSTSVASAETAAVSAPEPRMLQSARLLRTVAQAHIGDRITALRRGMFSPCAVSDPVRGSQGETYVFGTAHGALGHISLLCPVAFRLYSVLEKLVASRQETAGLALFSYRGFREVLVQGQVAKPNYQAPDRFASSGVCDGDVVEQFLKLGRTEQQEVVDAANKSIRQEIASKEWTGGAKTAVAKRPTVAQQLLGSSAPSQAESTMNNEGPANVAEISETELEEVNEVLQRSGMPSYPFTLDSVRKLVIDLQDRH